MCRECLINVILHEYKTFSSLYRLSFHLPIFEIGIYRRWDKKYYVISLSPDKIFRISK